MKWPISTIVFVILSFSFAFCVSDSMLNTVVVPAEYNKTDQRFINSTIEYIFLYKEEEDISLEGAKIVVESENATGDDPLIVVVKQKRGTLSWQIPMYVESDQDNTTVYYRTSRNLCPSKYYHSMKSHLKKKADSIYVSITISTSSKTSISFNLILLPVLNFYLKSGHTRNVTISPSEPVYYGYTFDTSTSKYVLITVNSYYKKDVCMTFAVEPTLCPVFDYQGNRHFTGLWQTVTTQGAITVSKQDYPHGFFIVLTVNPETGKCSKNDVESNRSKNVRLSISDAMSESDYVFPTLAPLLAVIGFCFIYGISALGCKVHLPPSHMSELYTEQETDTRSKSTSTDNEGAIGSINDANLHASVSNLLENQDTIVSVTDVDLHASVSNHPENEDRVVSVTNADLENSLEDNGTRIAHIRDLLKKEITILRKNSKLYVYFLLLIGTFYAVPVMQLVLNYEKTIRATGNQDLCYYNFLCSHPLFVLSDFNHVFSNFGFALLGLLFIFIVYMRERNDTLGHENANNENPRQYGLYYAMGFALMMEGLLSASYHICPNHRNFQFDISFMYIISILCIMKLYQNRHPDITAEAHVTFSAIAITIILGLAGIRRNKDQNFWIVFTIIHLTFCWYLSFKIYYMRNWRSIGRKVLKTLKSVRTGIKVHITHPYYPNRLWLIIAGNVCNICLAIFGILNQEIGFYLHLLLIMMANLVLYTVYYIIMKKCHGEKILPKTLIHIILTLISWSGAIYCFQAQSLSFSDTAANAREKNQTCVIGDFYDFHDMWHFLSALATFFFFMVLFTVDGDLCTCRNNVF